MRLQQNLSQLQSNLKILRFRQLNPAAWPLLKGIKQKLINFDIKPVKPIIPELLQQVEAAITAESYLLADKILNKILILNNANYVALVCAIDVNIILCRDEKAKLLLKRAIRYYPNDYKFHQELALLLGKEGKSNASAKYFKQALALCPDSKTIEIKHFYDAASGNTTSLAPRKYIVNLFDGYAPNFEHSLVKNLAYTGHITVAAALKPHISGQQTLERVIDLGCGTGLVGAELVKHFKITHLAGVDLSSKMLAVADEKKIYHSLHNSDLFEYLSAHEHQTDVIISSDVMIYLGDLAPLFAHCHRILKPKGFFAFNIEKLRWGDYKLSRTGRYQHSLQYIKSLYKRYHFSKMYSQTIELRKESGNMVAGYLVLLQR